MPNAKNKMAAVPYLNDRGERSMKKVKVERYVAGKKPSFAHEDEDEYYTTDDELDEEQEHSEGDDEIGIGNNDDNESNDDYDVKPQKPHRLKSVIANRFIEPERTSDRDEIKPNTQKQERLDRASSDDNDDDDDVEDPRFRKLKQLQAKSIPTNEQTSTSRSATRNVVTFESRSGTIIEDDEDEAEDDIRQRHALARTRKLDEPVGPQAVLGDIDDQIQDLKSLDDDAQAARLIDTDDLLSGFMPITLRAEELEAKDNEELEERLKEQLEEFKEQAILKAAVDKRVEEEIKLDDERLARSKAGDINTRDMNSVDTDDDEADQEAEFEAWTEREINRIVKYKAEYLRYQQSLASCH